MDEQAKEYLLKIPLWTKRKNTLEQVKDFLGELGNPENGMAVIHVAGTNGKGSVCADLTAVFKEAGYQVGTFLSPHLEDVRERILIGGDMAEEAVFQESFQQVLTVVRKMMGQGYCHPSFFEFLFLMAMVIFSWKKVDYAVLETGLGGRLDTTNVISCPRACVITSISLDHTKYLGGTIREIAAEKAGIIKPGVPVIFDDGVLEASQVIVSRAKELNAPVYPVREGEGKAGEWGCFEAPYQVQNAALAEKVFQVLSIPSITEDVCRRGFEKVHWPGRMEEAAPELWLDGAHNPGGIRAFAQAVKEQLRREKRKIHLLFAAVADKDYEEMIRLLCVLLPVERVTVVQLADERGMGAEALAEQFLAAGCRQVEAYKTIHQALWAARGNQSEKDRLYVVGSLYLIGEIKGILHGQEGGNPKC